MGSQLWSNLSATPDIISVPCWMGTSFFFLMQNPCQLEAFLWIGWRVCGVSTAPDHQSASEPQEGRPCLTIRPFSYSLFVIASVWSVLRHWLNQDFWDVPCSSRKSVLLELVPQSPACMFVFLPGGGAALQKKEYFLSAPSFQIFGFLARARDRFWPPACVQIFCWWTHWISLRNKRILYRSQ